MSKHRTGGPAFPLKERVDVEATGTTDYSYYAETGMTLRDYFAARVLGSTLPDGWTPEDCAEWAYTVADLMLRVREREQAIRPRPERPPPYADEPVPPLDMTPVPPLD